MPYGSQWWKVLGEKQAQVLGEVKTFSKEHLSHVF